MCMLLLLLLFGMCTQSERISETCLRDEQYITTKISVWITEITKKNQIISGKFLAFNQFDWRSCHIKESPDEVQQTKCTIRAHSSILHRFHRARDRDANKTQIIYKLNEFAFGIDVTMAFFFCSCSQQFPPPTLWFSLFALCTCGYI